MFDRTELGWFGKGDVSQANFAQGSYRASVTVRTASDFQLDIAVSLTTSNSIDARKHFATVARELLEAHPGIKIDENIKGIPTIKGNRISVGQVLGRLYVLDSIDAVVEYYSSAISKQQVKDAIAFAQDFLEAACEPI